MGISGGPRKYPRVFVTSSLMLTAMYADIVISLRHSSTNCGVVTLGTGMTRKTREHAMDRGHLQRGWSPYCHPSPSHSLRHLRYVVASQYQLLLVDTTPFSLLIDRIGIPPSIDGRCSATGHSVESCGQQDDLSGVSPVDSRTGEHHVPSDLCYVPLMCSFCPHP